MKKKRPRRKASKPPPETGAMARGPGSLVPEDAFLEYKIVELSTVDEGSLERALNHWTSEGWNFENVQFAMRESSKRPAMAFVFFTRESVRNADDLDPRATQTADAARDRLLRLADEELGPARAMVSPQQRLAELAEEDESMEPSELER